MHTSSPHLSDNRRARDDVRARLRSHSAAISHRALDLGFTAVHWHANRLFGVAANRYRAFGHGRRYNAPTFHTTRYRLATGARTLGGRLAVRERLSGDILRPFGRGSLRRPAVFSNGLGEASISA